MTQSRRTFVKHGMAMAAGIPFSRSVIPIAQWDAVGGHRPMAVPPVEDPAIKASIQRALDAAKTAKAEYAEARYTHHYTRGIAQQSVISTESIGVSVRAYINGYWGFASGPIWNPDEMVRLAKAATANAHASASAAGVAREPVLVARPVVQDKHWETPIEIDPFTIHPSYFLDHLGRAISYYIQTHPYGAGGGLGMACHRQEKAYGATDGTYISQRFCRTGASLRVELIRDGRKVTAGSDVFPLSSAGYELFDEVKLRSEADRLWNAIMFHGTLPTIPAEIGRFDTVFAPLGVAHLLSTTIGQATQLDRAMGLATNADGTSYLDDPDSMLESFPVASPLVNITADRTSARGAATVAWDDDGVIPEEFPLVTKGVLTNYQTSRDAVGLARAAYQKTNKPLVSNGCAQSASAFEPPMIHTPNLTMQPGQTDRSYEDLYRDMGDGIIVAGGILTRMTVPQLDQQLLNGYYHDEFYRVKQGKIVARINGSALLFRTPEIWKNIKDIGGASSAKDFSLESRRGQPMQSAFHSVRVVPMHIEKLTYIDAKRKA